MVSAVSIERKLALSQFGQASFGSINALLGGVVGTFTYDPAPTEMNWRSLFAAWYAEDTIRLTPKLTLSLGFRGESSTGWNEAHGRAANYLFTNGVINSTPHIGNSAFSVNNAKFLPEPRIGAAWSPFGTKTVIRAGFGMYNDLQDALGYRMDQNGPFNPTYAISSVPVANLPEPAFTGASDRKTGSWWSSAESEDSDADFVLSAARAGADTEHFAERRLRRIARLP